MSVALWPGREAQFLTAPATHAPGHRLGGGNEGHAVSSSGIGSSS
jgi:hypothetical protein